MNAPKCKLCSVAMKWSVLHYNYQPHIAIRLPAAQVPTATVTNKTQPVTVNAAALPKRGRGRPNSGNALTPAEKQRAYRERHA